MNRVVVLPIALLFAVSMANEPCSAKSRYQHEIRNGKFRASSRYPQRALPFFNRAIKLCPNKGQAYYERGTAYLKMEKQKLALNDFNKAVSLNYRKPILFYMRSRVHYEVGDKKAAIKDLDTYIKLVKNDEYKSDGYRNRAKMYRRLGQDAKAIADFTTSIKYHKSSSSYWNRGNIYYKNKQYKKALADYTRAIELGDTKDLDRIYSLRANAYEKLGMKTLAQKDRQFVADRVQGTWGSFMLEDVKKKK